MEIISLTGEVSRYNESSMWRQVSPVLNRNPGRIVLDFSDVQYMAISSIAVLIDLLIQAKSRSIKVAACGLSDTFLDLLELTKLSDYIEIYQRCDDAVAG